MRAFVHDLGKVAVPFRIWQNDGPPSADDWEKIRLHPYYTERILAGSPYLKVLADVARCHHETTRRKRLPPWGVRSGSPCIPRASLARRSRTARR